ncbi:MAG: RdgB/HAM1 family non-canonical purine NTP pyrophosphatase [Defluviitaleaceae bacterium]|nr:RdgB/HAM1 family non-canonical purine NTP pyrophosphatase [Defluviitaleaceae bacterium]
MKILLVTNNPGKAKEIMPMFEEAGLILISLADLGLHFEAKEDGSTFEENARQKATETAAYVEAAVGDTQALASFAILADDSGLEIDALGGAPGVDTALYMGRDTPYPEKCQSIIDKLAAVPEDKRTARFICTLVCLMPGGVTLKAEGTVEGRIARTLAGDGGFGYDPIFYYPPHDKTLAQLTREEKSTISHRGQAIQKMIGMILNAQDISNK